MSETIKQPGVQEQQLLDWAGEYAADPTNKLVALEYDPDTYPGQGEHVVHGNPQDSAIVDLIAKAAFEPYDYHSIHEQLARQEQQDRLEMAGELIKGGNNIIMATNHGDLIDIAIAHAAVYSQLDHKKYEPRTGIIISEMVSYLGFELGDSAAPCVEILQNNLENNIYLSYPRTASSEKRGLLHKNDVEFHNKRMRREVVKGLGGGAMLLAVAMSGTTDKPLEDDPNTLSMAAVTNGTLKTLTQPNTYVLPTALYYKDQESPFFALCDIPRLVTSEDVLHNAMRSIASTLSQEIPDKAFVYTESS